MKKQRRRTKNSCSNRSNQGSSNLDKHSVNTDLKPLLAAGVVNNSHVFGNDKVYIPRGSIFDFVVCVVKSLYKCAICTFCPVNLRFLHRF